MTRADARLIATGHVEDMLHYSTTPNVRSIVRGKSRDEMLATMDRLIERLTDELVNYESYADWLKEMRRKGAVA